MHHCITVFSAGSPCLKVVPWELRKLLKYIKDNYDDPRILLVLKMEYQTEMLLSKMITTSTTTGITSMKC